MHKYQGKDQQGLLFHYVNEYSASYDLDEAIRIAKDEAVKNHQYRKVVKKDEQYIIVSTSGYYNDFFEEEVIFECDHRGEKVDWS